MGTPNRWLLPTTTSAPMEPGLWTRAQASEVRGHDHANVSNVGLGNVSRPTAPPAPVIGYWTIMPNVRSHN